MSASECVKCFLANFGVFWIVSRQHRPGHLPHRRLLRCRQSRLDVHGKDLPPRLSTRRPTPTPPAPDPRRRPCSRRRPPLQQAAVLRPPGRDQLLHGQPAAHGLPAVSVVRSADRQRGQSRGPARNVVANPPRPRSRLTDRYHSDGLHPRQCVIPGASSKNPLEMKPMTHPNIHSKQVAVKGGGGAGAGGVLTCGYVDKSVL